MRDPYSMNSQTQYYSYGGRRNMNISCVYPMTATLAQLVAIGPSIGLTINQALTLSNYYQTGSYAIASGLSSSVTAAMTSNTDMPQTFDLSSGKKALEAVIVPPASGTNVESAAVILDTSLTHSLKASAIVGASGTYTLTISKNGVGVSTTSGLTGTAAILYEFDSGAGTYIVKLNNTPLTLSDNTYTPGNNYGLLGFVKETTGVDAANRGLMTSVTFNTAFAGIFSKVDTGYTDLCGNVM